MKMRTQLYIFAGLIFSLACRAEPPVTKKAASCCAKESASLSATTNSAPLTDASLYQLESVWTNDAGKAAQLVSLRGKPQIITMFFASCNYACPLLVHDMQRIEKALPAELRSKVGFTLVTIDPERDTPAALKEYRTTRQLADNWTLLHGNSEDILELAALLGVKFKKESSGQFAHSNVITILNAKGEIVFQQIGLNKDPASTIAKLEKLFETGL